MTTPPRTTTRRRIEACATVSIKAATRDFDGLGASAPPISRVQASLRSEPAVLSSASHAAAAPLSVFWASPSSGLRRFSSLRKRSPVSRSPPGARFTRRTRSYDEASGDTSRLVAGDRGTRLFRGAPDDELPGSAHGRRRKSGARRYVLLQLQHLPHGDSRTAGDLVRMPGPHGHQRRLQRDPREQHAAQPSVRRALLSRILRQYRSRDPALPDRVTRAAAARGARRLSIQPQRP